MLLEDLSWKFQWLHCPWWKYQRTKMVIKTLTVHTLISTHLHTQSWGLLDLRHWQLTYNWQLRTCTLDMSSNFSVACAFIIACYGSLRQETEFARVIFFTFFFSLSTTWSTQKVFRFLLEKLQELGAVSHLCVQNSLPKNLIEISEFPTCVLCN
jgi:hypothetical protein